MTLCRSCGRRDAESVHAWRWPPLSVRPCKIIGATMDIGGSEIKPDTAGFDGRAGDRVRRLLEQGAVVVLTGAGLSTSSGIPAYRDREGNWQDAQPVRQHDFLHLESARRRYWARSFFGWPSVAGAAPGRGHHALARLEQAGRIDLVVTQNVDGLHDQAGSKGVVDLHGRIDTVCCLACGQRQPRLALQRELLRRNPQWAARDALAAPDGDADLEALDFSGFDVPDCADCGGMLKPDVVFFGENVPRERVAAARAALARSDALLVAGSSLMVYSGFRFVKAMVEAGKPVAAINRGRTRADDLLELKVSANCADALRRICS